MSYQDSTDEMPRDSPNLPSEETGPNEPTYAEIIRIEGSHLC